MLKEKQYEEACGILQAAIEKEIERIKKLWRGKAKALAIEKALKTCLAEAANKSFEERFNHFRKQLTLPESALNASLQQRRYFWAKKSKPTRALNNLGDALRQADACVEILSFSKSAVNNHKLTEKQAGYHIADMPRAELFRKKIREDLTYMTVQMFLDGYSAKKSWWSRHADFMTQWQQKLAECRALSPNIMTKSHQLDFLASCIVAMQSSLPNSLTYRHCAKLLERLLPATDFLGYALAGNELLRQPQQPVLLKAQYRKMKKEDIIDRLKSQYPYFNEPTTPPPGDDIPTAFENKNPSGSWSEESDDEGDEGDRLIHDCDSIPPTPQMRPRSLSLASIESINIMPVQTTPQLPSLAGSPSAHTEISPLRPRRISFDDAEPKSPFEGLVWSTVRELLDKYKFKKTQFRRYSPFMRQWQKKLDAQMGDPVFVEMTERDQVGFLASCITAMQNSALHSKTYQCLAELLADILPEVLGAGRCDDSQGVPFQQLMRLKDKYKKMSQADIVTYLQKKYDVYRVISTATTPSAISIGSQYSSGDLSPIPAEQFWLWQEGEYTPGCGVRQQGMPCAAYASACGTLERGQWVRRGAETMSNLFQHSVLQNAA